MANQPTIEELKAQLAQANAERDEALGIIEDQKKVITQLEGVKTSFPTLSHGGKVYEIQAPTFVYEGVEYTAASIQANSELAAALIELEAGILVDVTPEEKK